MHGSRITALGLWVCIASACSNPTSPSEVLDIACPSPVIVESLNGQPMPVSFPAPTATGGSGTVTVTCTHQSGALFPVGTTNVTCTARDFAQKTDSCSFAVTVSRPPQLTVTRFVAFGDSITQGSSAACGPRELHVTPDFLLADVRRLRAHIVSQPYPSVLQMLLAARYRADVPTVANEGLGGEVISDSDTRDRLNAAITRHAAQVVLLQEGVNDLHDPLATGALAIDAAIDGLDRAIALVRNRGARVMLGTLLPERPGSCRAFAPELIDPANARIRLLALAHGVTLVDLNAAFAGQVGTLLGEDGLHPSDAGYQRIAEVFSDAIRATLEQPPGAPAPSP